MKIAFDTTQTTNWCKKHSQGLGLTALPVGLFFAAHYCAVQATGQFDAAGKAQSTIGIFWILSMLVFGLGMTITLGVGIAEVYKRYLGAE